MSLRQRSWFIREQNQTDKLVFVYLPPEQKAYETGFLSTEQINWNRERITS